MTSLNMPFKLENSPSKNSITMSTHSPVPTNEKTLRDYVMLSNARRYPNITPRDDADMLILAHHLYEGPESTIYDYLTHTKTAESFPELSASESLAITINASTQILATPLSEVAGLKPEAIERPIPELLTSPIPDTEYSLRIWAGPLVRALFNMDFVCTATGKPVNSPFEFKLFAVGSIYNPWSRGLGGFPREIHSGEATLAAGQEILPGEEKFFLVDGGHYALVRPGKRDVLFIVPQRLSPTPPNPPNGDVLNFSSSI